MPSFDDPSSITTPIKAVCLNLDCIRAVINHVHDPYTLFCLLTVSKDVFYIAVGKLYWALFSYPSISKYTVLRRIRLVLSLTPYHSAMADSARRGLQVQWPRQEPPYVDYLSLVRDASLEELNYDTEQTQWCDEQYLHYTRQRGLVQWAIVGHRLADIEVIRLDRNNLGRYIAHMGQLTSLKRVVFHPAEDFDIEVFVGFERRFSMFNTAAGEEQAPPVELLLYTEHLSQAMVRTLRERPPAPLSSRLVVKLVITRWH